MTHVTTATAVFALVVTASALAKTAAPMSRPATQPQTPPAAPQVPPPASKPAAPQSVPFPADAKIAFIDFQTLVSDSKIGKTGSARMKVLTDKQAADLNARSKAIQTLQQQIQQQTGVLSPQALQEKQADLSKLQREAQYAQQDWQAQVDSLNKQLLDDFQEKALPIVEEVRKEKGLWAIFNLQSSGVVASHPGLELSAEVVKRLDAKYPGGRR